MTEIGLSTLGKRFGDFSALSGMNLTIADGEFVALLGPPGCGKSTTMNMIAGMLRPSEGDILFDGKSIVGVPMGKRGVGFVFQNYAIFTHMTIRENLAYGLRVRRMSAAERGRRVDSMVEFLQLTPLLDRKAAGLSVNILQRVAIGLSAAVQPAIFLLDEPLSNVDAAFREVMRSELKSLQRQFRQTMVYVTHDQLEAMTMADRIAVMDHGKLLQVGSPIEVYNHPADAFVARFIGAPSMNILDGRPIQDDSGWRVDLGTIGRSDHLPEPLAHAVQSVPAVAFGFRPEQMVPDDAGALSMAVVFIERIGARRILHLEADGIEAKASFDLDTPVPQAGAMLRFSIPSDAIRLFDAETARAVGDNTVGGVH